MLNNAKEGEKIGVDGDVYVQVAEACKGARPKIQRWIEQDTGEREGMMGEHKFRTTLLAFTRLVNLIFGVRIADARA